MIGHGLFIYLNMNSNDDELCSVVDFVQSSEMFVTKIVEKLGIKPIEGSPTVTNHGFDKLGIQVPEINDDTEDIIIGFVISSDLNS